jgi:hypothetical protein
MVIDGKKFVKCTFENCHLVYKGGKVPVFSGCNMNGCLWVFDEAAHNTLEWLHRLRHYFLPHGEQTFRQVVEDIDKASPTGGMPIDPPAPLVPES